MSSPQQSNGLGRAVIVILAILVALPLLMMLVFFPLMGMWGGGMMGYGGMMDGYGAYGGGLWAFLMPLVWLLVLLGGGYLGYRWLAGSESLGSDPALEELRLAYARGDISEEEFEERRARLTEE